MSLLRDSEIVNGLARNLHLKDLTNNACKVILSETEIMLRTIIIEMVKYTKKFHRDTIILADLDIVLDQLNLHLLSMGIAYL
jgi:hypothetical protein